MMDGGQGDNRILQWDGVDIIMWGEGGVSQFGWKFLAPESIPGGVMGLLKSSMTSLGRAEPGSQWVRDRLNPWTPGSSGLLSHDFCLLWQLWGFFSIGWDRKHHSGPKDITGCHRCLWQSPKTRRLRVLPVPQGLGPLALAQPQEPS